MNEAEAQKLVNAVFKPNFDLTSYKRFIVNLLDCEFETQTPTYSGDKIKSVEAIGKKDGLSLFVVEFFEQRTLQRARALQRNLIAKYLKNSYQKIALVVFTAQDSQDWRFSFIKLESWLEVEDGKRKFIEELTPARRYSFLINSTGCHTVKNRFLELLQKKPSFAEIEAAFSVEVLNKEFYHKLYNWYERAQPKVTFPNDLNSENHIQTSLVRLLTRLLFVWFIKEKKLINSALFDEEKVKEYLHYDKSSSYYKAILQNLFFATLNREIGKRGFRTKDQKNNYLVTNIYRYRAYFKAEDEASILALFSQTPFLNGGLFECLDREANAQEKQNYDKTTRQSKSAIRLDGFSDREDNALVFPNNLFFNEAENQLGLITLLKQYQFTVEESSPFDVEVALDPELLGKVFENLLASFNPETGEQARKASGSFYTPRVIVDYMVNESLKQHFQSNANLPEKSLKELKSLVENSDFLEEDKKPDFSADECQQIVNMLDQIKLLDPAVGSGAFAMGLLNKLVAILKFIDPQNKFFKQKQIDKADNIEDPESREKAIAAIQLVFAQENDYNDYGKKLYLIENSIYGIDIQPIAIQICKLRFFITLVIEQNVTNPDKTKNYGIRPLPNLETKFIIANSLIPLGDISLELFNGDIEKTKRELKGVRTRIFTARTFQTKKKYRQKDRKLREALKQIIIKDNAGKNEKTRDIARKLADWNPYNPDASAAWFDPMWMFGFDEFDIVIGNPPYIQLQKGGGKLGNLYKNLAYQSFTRMGDIYCLFYELGNKLLKLGGTLVFITSNKWLRAGYGKLLRQYLAQNTSPQILIDLGPGVFENATVDTNILLSQKKQEPPKTYNCRACDIKIDLKKEQTTLPKYIDQHKVSISNFSAEAWVILNPLEQSIRRKMETSGTPLKDWDIQINRGILTGYNKAFIIDGNKRAELIAQDPKSAEIIKPILRGRDIKRYHAEFADQWLIATHNGYKNEEDNVVFPIDMDDYPAVKAWLNTHWQRIKNRLDKGNTPYNLRSCAYHQEFEKEKIVWSEMTRENSFIWNDDGVLMNQTCYFIPNANKFWLSILNSKIIFWYFTKCLGADLGTGAFRWIKQYVEEISIPQISPAKQRPFIELVDQILTITAVPDYNSKQPPPQQKVLEAKIDALVFELYGLAEAERNLVLKES